MTNDQALHAFGQATEQLQKALKAPAPTIERARARQAWLRFQREFRTTVTNIYGTMQDVGATAKWVTEEMPGAKERVAGLVTRQHGRSIAMLNAQFSSAYERAFELGLRTGGAVRETTENELAIVRRQRLNENTYAGNFLTDLGHGEGTMPWEKRADLYANALEEVFWQGYLYSDCSADRYIRWVEMPAVETCLDCAFLAGRLSILERPLLAKADLTPREETLLATIQARKADQGGRWGTGVYSARELATMGIVPQSGKLQCTTQCHCKLQPAKRPEGIPERTEAQEPYQSLLPKAFTGTGTNARGKVVVAREHKQVRRMGYAKRAATTEHRHIGRGETAPVKKAVAVLKVGEQKMLLTQGWVKIAQEQ